MLLIVFVTEVPVNIRWMVLSLLFVSLGAAAQMYKWTDKDGKVRYGDTPPPGVKAAPVAGASSASAPPSLPSASSGAPAMPGSADAKKGPLSPAEREQEYRKRQEEQSKAAAKTASEAEAKSQRNEACDRSKEYLRTLESGQRIARTNSAGERYYLDDSQVAGEVAKAQQSIQQACK
jgi:hypothetical protein